jgi:outer membrane lipoprotein-sorting protein
MRCFTLLAVLCLAAPASAQDSTAEKIYRAMENKVRGAKTLQVALTAEMDSAKFKGTMKGTVYSAQGNKGRMEMDSDVGGKSEKMLMITDGKVSYDKQGDKVNVDPKPKNVDQLDKMLPGFLGRCGLAGGFLFSFSGPSDPDKKQEPFDIDKELPIKNFKLGVKEKVGDRNAQVVDYQIDIAGKAVKVSVWIDTQTQVPLKRVLVLDEGGQTMRITETYATFNVDGKLDPKLFEIPK